ncbi:MAG: 6-carboxyhexanoate--CoA ligase [Candidatus Methanoperedens sp.]|nr:6-carboxyhexanoate--CoA ligase [Candidatus Methanoperedens sp.]MCZ7359707.1 6-carboxyhexanoate--CoA ligase [Candidatus Methanoperedens sp.]HLB69685.1 6-carboxyhexanoate--CoA ligase [Candidatus Methanoperedens sp.]
MYSVRMRASRDGKHISGAEHLIQEEEIINSALSLIERALTHERGKPDFVNISFEELKSPIKRLTSLPITLLNAENVEEGKNSAKSVLRSLGIPDICIESAFTLLEKGPSDRESMRGAILMDMLGNRHEPDRRRGIRATRMDITREASEELAHTIAVKGLSPYNTRIKEALILATKVANVRGTIAELCWSDDPSYTTGYVASKKMGYIRIPHMKYQGDPHGGRVFFVDKIDTAEYINEIENSPVLVNKFGGLKNGIDNITWD